MTARDMAPSASTLSDREYSEFSEFLKRESGIFLGESKQYLVSTRVRRILSDSNIASVGALLERISRPGEAALKQRVIDAMTTNETFWFRDNYPFDYLANTLIGEFAEKKQSRIKIWSAACSSGQEPYSLSMIFEEAGRSRIAHRNVEADITATDVSSSILESAKQGRYDKISLVRGLSQQRAKDYFTQVDNDTWEVVPKIKQRVRFRPLNLQESYYLLGKFDIIFCRNVLIYFTAELKREILTKMHGALNPGGMLFLGSSESIAGLNDLFQMVHCNPGVAYKAK